MLRALRRWTILDAFLVGSALGILASSSWLYARFGFTPLAGISNDLIESHMVAKRTRDTGPFACRSA